MGKVIGRDYSLTGAEGPRAIEKGLAEAQWYTSPIPREQMRELLKRKNYPAIRDSLIWFALLFGSGYTGYALWGSWWALVPFAVYAIIYSSSSDSRWHESSHGTAFKTDWMNNALYEIASFMVVRESTSWRWSHARHHSDTIIVGRDPEIAVPRPAKILSLIKAFFALESAPRELKRMCIHASGRMTEAEKTYMPQEEYRWVYLRARIYLLIYASVIGLAIYSGSILPLMYVGLPSLYGSWLMVVFGLTQHAGLAEDVLDHRLNCRTVYMNRIFRYLYWNMNYHVEHHMFPVVPYHALPRLHELMKDDSPPAYSGLLEAYREIIPTLFRQARDPSYYVKRPLPARCGGGTETIATPVDQAEGELVLEGDWVDVCSAAAIDQEEVYRYDRGEATYVIYRTKTDEYFASDGYCTHQQAHLSEGMLSGYLIECPKHNGRFDIRDGSVQRRPVRAPLKMYEVRVERDRVLVKLPTGSSPVDGGNS